VIARLNKPVLLSVLLLAGMGLLSLWTAEPLTDLSGTSITQSNFLRQAVFLAAGLALMVLVALPNYQHYRRGALFLYIVCGIALAALLILGRYSRGARGWFAVGPFKVQPAEFMKIALVLSLARVLMYARDITRWRGLLLPIALTAGPAALVLLQPDLGTALLFVPTLLAMLYAAGARKRHLAAIVAVLLVAAPLAYSFGLKEYQRNRLISFLFPEKVPPDLRYQQEQSVRACASGRFAGRGLGESGAALPFNVPDRHTDFVYSITAEEMGFAGSTFVLLLFALYFAQSLGIARQSREPFGRLTVTGLTALLATQTFINLGMTLGVAPITGVTLPFVSYGGSSLLTCCLAAGLVLNVGARWQPAFSSQALAGDTREIRGFQPQEAKWLPH
jgi:rod shape-determining protein RodA